MKTFQTYIEMKQYIADVYFYTKKSPTGRRQHFYVAQDKKAYTYYPNKDLIVYYSGS